MNIGHQVTLSSKKVVILRDPTIGDQELAAQAIANKASENKFVFALQLSKEMTRNLIYSIDGKEVKSHESLDSMLTLQEYQQVQRVVSQLTGLGEDASPTIEAVNIGGK